MVSADETTNDNYHWLYRIAVVHDVVGCPRATIRCALPGRRSDRRSDRCAWKLNIEKSTNSTAESELISITSQGNQFQITFQAIQSNKYNPHYQIVTDMKGETSKPVQADGKPMSDEWRVTRTQPNSFVVESVGPFSGAKHEYAVSTDGGTFTVHEMPDSAPRVIAGKMDSNGVMHRVQQVLVFDKIQNL